jgi:hypothetical protein
LYIFSGIHETVNGSKSWKITIYRYIFSNKAAQLCPERFRRASNLIRPFGECRDSPTARAVLGLAQRAAST